MNTTEQIKELHLAALRFEKVVVTPEDSGEEHEYHYWTRDLGQAKGSSIFLLTDCSDADYIVSGEGWRVYLGMDMEYIITDLKQLTEVIHLFDKLQPYETDYKQKLGPITGAAI